MSRVPTKFKIGDKVVWKLEYPHIGLSMIMSGVVLADARMTRNVKLDTPVGLIKVHSLESVEGILPDTKLDFQATALVPTADLKKVEDAKWQKT